MYGSSVSIVAVSESCGINVSINVSGGNGHIHYSLMLGSSLSSGEEIRHAGIACYNSGGNVYTRRKHVTEAEYSVTRIAGFGQKIKGGLCGQMKRMAPASSEEGCYRQ